MITIVLFGEKDNYSLLDFLVKVFANHAVFHYEKDNCHYQKGTGDIHILLIDTDDLVTVKTRNCLVVFKEKLAMQAPKDFQTTQVCLLSSENATAVLMASLLQCKAVTLGLRSTDTLSISSTLDDSSVISLLREIENMYGEMVEPFDVVIEKTCVVDDYYLLISVFLMLYFDVEFSLNERIKI